MSATAIDVVQAAVQDLLRLAGPADHDTADALRQRLIERRLRVLIVGEAKRGKSTLINALVDRDVLPVGVVPVTAVTTTVRYDHRAEDHLNVAYQDGRRKRGQLADLANLVTERANPDNVLGVATVDVVLAEGPLAARAVELALLIQVAGEDDLRS